MRIPVTYKPELIVSKDTTRGAICNVEFFADPPRLVATDGYMIVVLPVVLEDDDIPPKVMEGPIPGEAFIRARKLAKADKLTDMTIKIRADKYEFADGSTMPRILTPHDNFPDYKQVIPPARKHGEGDTILLSFNLKLLSALGEALSGQKGGGNITIQLTPNPKTSYCAGEIAEIRVTRNDRDSDQEVAVLMPVRI